MRHLLRLVRTRTALAGAGILVLLLACPDRLRPQDLSELKQVLERLDQLARENQALREEIRALRDEVRALRTQRMPEEKLEIQERRIAEQAQIKVEASQRFPIRLSGMALFNAFLNGRHSGGSDLPVRASLQPGPRAGGATFRQSMIGLEYEGPVTIGGGRVRGYVNMDFFAGSSSVLNHLFRIRTAAVEVNWRNRSILAGLEKPVFNPREPASLAQVGFSPLTGSGNLWIWQPQIRFEQRLRFGEGTELGARVGVVQVTDPAQTPGLADAYSGEFRRPALQGRFELVHRLDDRRRIEIAPGFHFSKSQPDGGSVPSRLFSLDWMANPWPKLEFSGVFFSGRNLGMFGAPGQGIVERPGGVFLPVHSRGGWGQLSFLVTDRLSFNLFGGQHDDRNRDLDAGQIGKNFSYAGNVMYRLAPNVLVSLEALQLRTSYVGAGRRINNRYDLALAYLF